MSDPRRSPLPMRHTAEYRVRFDEATPAGLLRGSALLGYVQDVAWRHSEALGFPRAWYRAKGVAWLVRAVEARFLGPMADGETLVVTTQLTGSRRVMMRRRTDVAGAAGDLRAVVTIDWAMTDGRAPVRIPVEFEQAPLDGPGPVRADPRRPSTRAVGPDDAPLLAPPPRARPDEPREQRGLPRLARRSRRGRGADRRGGDRERSRGSTGWSTSARPDQRWPSCRLAWLERAGDDGPPAGWAYRLADADGTDLLRGRLDPA